ncbi:AAA family ATPase [[Phormidium] sp. ETS-05]|uniref:AAA family ATPase n=1 Tax=[Phormidium] sp. ETS-05 TaxID=222819 RepID=UPI0018EF3527|nr:ATP-binding protein [[Phormidium] sp. ETS-05]
MLDEVKLHNFKSHQATELRLDNSRFHALVGQNSAGKTSVLQALHYLSLLADSSFSRIFQYDKAPQFITTIGAEEMCVTASGFWGFKEPKYWEAAYSWQQREGGWVPTVSWQVEQNRDDSSGWSESFSNAPHPIGEAIRHAVYLKLVSSNLAKAAYSEAETPRVEFDGSGLAPTLDFLRNEAPDKFELLQEMLRRIVPGVREVGIRRAKVKVNREKSIQVDGKLMTYDDTQEMSGQEVVLSMNTGERIPAHAVSEGTIITLGLLAVLLNPTQPNLVLLDDVEQGLHPKAQRELMTVFKTIIAEHKNLQIIFSTHSPYIIDELMPSQVHVLHNSDVTGTVAKRLDEHPDVEWAKHTLTTGEFWDAEGEEWVVAGEISV